MINWKDVVLTIIALVIVLAGFAFEFAGETVKGWHTISWWAHRNKWLRYTILVIGLVVLGWLVFHHFASPWIVR